MKVMFTGGGSGGHLLPIIAVARELRRNYKGEDLEFFYIGPEDKFGDILLQQESIKVYSVKAGKVRRYWKFKTVFQNLFDMLIKTPLGVLKAFRILFFVSPDLIFSKGGYGAIPTTIAARFLRIPVFLHESDIIPGRANRSAEKFALEIFTSFPHTRHFSPKKLLLVGNPIRRRLLSGSQEQAKQIFQMAGGKPVLLILGGSQGAQRINDMLLAILNDILKEFEIIHQTGEKNFLQVQQEAKIMMAEENFPYYHPIAFLSETNLRHAYAACDFIISRAGSGSIFEIAAIGKPSILIPLPESAQNHQLENAYAYASTKAAIVLEEGNLKPHFFLERLRNIIYDQKEMNTMTAAAIDFSRPNASVIIAQYLLAYLIR